jgi:hypothetical protein
MVDVPLLPCANRDSDQLPRLLDVSSACSRVNVWAEACGPLRDDEE